MVTLPPVIYDLADPARTDFVVTNHYFGPFEFSGPNRQYVVLFSLNGISSSTQIRVYKSLDGGLSWSRQDQANEVPDCTGYDVTQDGTTLHIVYSTEITGELRHITFSCATDTYGAIVGGGPIIGGVPFHTTRATSGEITVVYLDGLSFGNSLKYVMFSGGAWGVATTYVASPNGNAQFVFLNSQIDSNDVTRAYFTLSARVFLGDKELHQRSLTVGGVVGGLNVIDNTITDISFVGISRSTEFNGQLYVPYLYRFLPKPRLAKVWVSSDLTPTPTWTTETVDLNPVVTSGGDDGESYALTSNDGLTVYVFWVALDYSDLSNIIDRLYYASNTGSGWSQPILMYDAVTNPQLEDPGLPDDLQDIHTLSIVQLAAGNFGISTALEENGFCAGYALIDGVTAPCVITTIPATVAGVVTMPPVTQAKYAQTLIAFEIPGDTFRYTITSPQHLPDGLKMSNQTRTVVSDTGPIEVNDGILIEGEPTYSDYQTPVTTSVAMNLRLIS